MERDFHLGKNTNSLQAHIKKSVDTRSFLLIVKTQMAVIIINLMAGSCAVRFLRFLRPVCTTRDKDFGDLIELLGYTRHPNLVPLLGFYAGPRGEKLLVHPFYKLGNLSQFIREATGLLKVVWLIASTSEIGLVPRLSWTLNSTSEILKATMREWRKYSVLLGSRICKHNSCGYIHSFDLDDNWYITIGHCKIAGYLLYCQEKSNGYGFFHQINEDCEATSKPSALDSQGS
ncbi:hypothetical protein QYF36_018445 [Acer negundo]|nr:hypothetical protein QYF36_018445 [Acer negundo]